MPKEEKTIIIGASPGGASAAIYLARFCHPVLLLDAPALPGRTMQADILENVLGFTKPVSGAEFMKKVHRQLRRFPVELKKELVIKVQQEKEGIFSVFTDKPAHYKATYVVVAVGVHDVLPDVPEVEQYFGKSIFQCPTCNWFQTKDQPTAIIANDDSGITMALAFNAMQAGSATYVIPDRPRTHFSAAMLKKAKNNGITVYLSPLLCLKGKEGILTSVTLTDGTEVEVEILYSKLGVKRLDTFLEPQTAEVERNEEGYIKVDFDTLETSRSNLFAVGPCTTGHDQVIVAAGQGAAAALTIHGRILINKGI